MDMTTHPALDASPDGIRTAAEHWLADTLRRAYRRAPAHRLPLARARALYATLTPAHRQAVRDSIVDEITELDDVDSDDDGIDRIARAWDRREWLMRAARLIEDDALWKQADALYERLPELDPERHPRGFLKLRRPTTDELDLEILQSLLDQAYEVADRLSRRLAR